MDTRRWQRIDELFNAAVSCPPAERDGLLACGCGDDSVLRGEIEGLLAAHERASSFIELPAFELSQRRPTEAAAVFAPGHRIARYTIRSVLGYGGMGVVYEAEQDRPRRRVALKVLRAALPTRELLMRFAQEAELLGRLQHPGIAQIFEADAGDNILALPYIVMELVDGEPITRYCARTSASHAQRVELLIQVCAAVDHAHQRGIIHRDLKPANIVVTHDGQPKVLDFGAALWRAANSVNCTLSASPGQVLGTLAYMSPEQVSADRPRIGPQTDVYALGASLFELLTGKLPHDLTNLTIAQAAAVICATDPIRPTALDPSINPAVEAIVLTAIARDPAERYPTVAALAADLRRALNGDRPQAIVSNARPARAWPRAAGLGALLTGAAAVAIWTIWGNYGAPAQQNSEVALSTPLPEKVDSVAREQPVPGRSIRPVPPGERRRALDDNPIVMADSWFRSEMRSPLNEDLESAESDHRKRLATAAISDRPTRHGLHRDLGLILELQGRFAEAEEAYRAALEVVPNQDFGRPGVLLTRDKIAGVVAAQGRTDEAERMWIEALSRGSAKAARADVIARMRARYATLLAEQRRWSDAIEQLEVSIRELSGAPEANADALTATRNLLDELRRRAAVAPQQKTPP